MKGHARADAERVGQGDQPGKLRAVADDLESLIIEPSERVEGEMDLFHGLEATENAEGKRPSLTLVRRRCEVAKVDAVADCRHRTSHVRDVRSHEPLDGGADGDGGVRSAERPARERRAARIDEVACVVLGSHDAGADAAGRAGSDDVRLKRVQMRDRRALAAHHVGEPRNVRPSERAHEIRERVLSHASPILDAQARVREETRETVARRHQRDDVAHARLLRAGRELDEKALRAATLSSDDDVDHRR